MTSSGGTGSAGAPTVNTDDRPAGDSRIETLRREAAEATRAAETIEAKLAGWREALTTAKATAAEANERLAAAEEGVN